MIELYCIVDDPSAGMEACAAALPDGTVVVRAGGVACVGRRDAEPDPAPGGHALVEHDRVLGGLMRGCTVVPFRYGTVLPGEEEVRRHLESRADEFAALLSWLRGRVELALRANGPVAGRPPRCDGSGASYLRMLRHKASRPVLAGLHETLARAAVAATITSDRQCGIKSSYLVDKDRVDQFCRLLADTLADLDGVRAVSLTGPWAPYSFVAEAPGGAVDPHSHGVVGHG